MPLQPYVHSSNTVKLSGVINKPKHLRQHRAVTHVRILPTVALFVNFFPALPFRAKFSRAVSRQIRQDGPPHAVIVSA